MLYLELLFHIEDRVRLFLFFAFCSCCLFSVCFFPFPDFFMISPHGKGSCSLYLFHFLPFSLSLHLFYSSGVRCLFRLIDIIILKNMKLYIAIKKFNIKNSSKKNNNTNEASLKRQSKERSKDECLPRLSTSHHTAALWLCGSDSGTFLLLLLFSLAL